MRTGQGDGFGRGDGRKLGKADMIVYFVLSHLATHPLSTLFLQLFFSQTGNPCLTMNSVKPFVEHTRDWTKHMSCASQEAIKSVLHWSRVERNARTFWERFFEKRYAQMWPGDMWPEILEGHG